MTTVSVTGMPFGTGDGATRAFQLLDGENAVYTPLTETIFRNDWQGNQQLYPTARTNVVFYSSVLSNGKGATASNGSFVSASIGLPDGTTGTAYAFVPNTTSTPHYFDSKGVVSGSDTHISVPVGTPLSMSIWFKAAGYSLPELRLYNNARAYLGVMVDLTTGNYRTTSGGTQTGFAASNISVYAGTNGWYRVSFTCVAPNDTGTDWIPSVLIWTGTLSSPTQTFAGDGVSGVYAWGREYELASVVGSYIPTSATPVTVTDYTIARGLVTLASAPLSGAALTWTGTYTWPSYGGYGKYYYYGRGLYGQLQIASGAIVSSASASSVIAGGVTRLGGMAAPSSWAESSTAAAHPIEAGRVVHSAALASTRGGYLHAAGRYTADAVLADAIAGQRKPIGQYVGSAVETSRVIASLHASAIYVADAVLTSAADGRKLWEDDAPDPDPGWAPQPKPTSIWTAVPEGTSPWTRVHR